MSWSVVGVLVVLAGMVLGVVKYLRRVAVNSVALGERDAELDIERERVRRLEETAAKERADRQRVLREKAAAIRDAIGASELLRRVTKADDPKVN